MKNINTLVLSGGGIYGISHIGVLQFLHENNILKNIKTFCGVSIGALICSLIILGYTPKELYEILILLDLSAIKKISFENINNFGLDNGSRIEQTIQKLIVGKGFWQKITLSQLYNITKINLIIPAICINTTTIQYMSHKSHPNISLYLAIRMSISIPFYFTPVSYNNKLFIDGGIIDNYPIHYFKDNIKHTLGVHLISNHTVSKNISNIEEYVIRVLYCLRKGNEFNAKKGYEKNTINIYSGEENPAEIINFNINKKKKNKLYTQGYTSTDKYFNKYKIKNKPIDNKPIDNKHIDNKLINNKHINNKPIDNKHIDNKPINNKHINNKPINNKHIDNKPIDNKKLK